MSMNDFISLIGTYWVDLIEQVIPSTTIWGSTYKYNNTIFDNNKFKYKKSTLFVCKPPSEPVSPIIGMEPLVSADITTYYYDDNSELVEENTSCDASYVLQISDGSEFIGNVSVIGNIKGNKFDGDMITLNESEDSTIQKII